MKRILLLFLIIATPVLAADNTLVPHISVTGTARRLVAPDLMEWNLDVSTQGADVPSVAERHRQTVQAVLAFLTEQQIPENRVQTARMQLRENWQFRDGNTLPRRFHRLDQRPLRLARLEMYDALWTGLSRISNVSVSYVNLTLENAQDIRNEVKIEALAAARDKARAMSAALDTALGEVLSISEDRDSSGPIPVPLMARAESFKGTDSGSSISPGQIEVYAEVFVVFSLVKR
jgi:uncharacterized protein YggE